MRAWVRNSKYLPLVLWILLNTIGIYYMSGNPYLINLFDIDIFKKNSLLQLLAYSISIGLPLAALQTIFHMFFRFSKSLVLWFLATWVSLSIADFIVRLPLFHMIWIIFKIPYNYMSIPFVGVRVYSETLLYHLLSAAVFGVLTGLINGVLLGIAQFGNLIPTISSRKWLTRTIISLALGLFLGSMIIAWVTRIPINKHSFYQLIPLIEIVIGLIYGLSTGWIIVGDRNRPISNQEMQKQP